MQKGLTIITHDLYNKIYNMCGRNPDIFSITLKHDQHIKNVTDELYIKLNNLDINNYNEKINDLLNKAKLYIINIVSYRITDNTLSSKLQNINGIFDMIEHKIIMLFQREHIKILMKQNEILNHAQYAYCHDVKYEHSE